MGVDAQLGGSRGYVQLLSRDLELAEAAHRHCAESATASGARTIGHQVEAMIQKWTARELVIDETCRALARLRPAALEQVAAAALDHRPGFATLLRGQLLLHGVRAAAITHLLDILTSNARRHPSMMRSALLFHDVRGEFVEPLIEALATVRDRT
jgi:hypothetical protein